MSWAWNSQEEEHPPAMDLRALSSLPSKTTWVGKTQKGHLGHSVPLWLCLGWGGRWWRASQWGCQQWGLFKRKLF